MDAESIGGKLSSSSTDTGLWWAGTSITDVPASGEGGVGWPGAASAALRGFCRQSRVMLSLRKRQSCSRACVGYRCPRDAASAPRLMLPARLVGVFFGFVLLLSPLWAACRSPGTPAIERS